LLTDGRAGIGAIHDRVDATKAERIVRGWSQAIQSGLFGIFGKLVYRAGRAYPPNGGLTAPRRVKNTQAERQPYSQRSYTVADGIDELVDVPASHDRSGKPDRVAPRRSWVEPPKRVPL